jgi:hypothetical protein
MWLLRSYEHKTIKTARYSLAQNKGKKERENKRYGIMVISVIINIYLYICITYAPTSYPRHLELSWREVELSGSYLGHCPKMGGGSYHLTAQSWFRRSEEAHKADLRPALAYRRGSPVLRSKPHTSEHVASVAASRGGRLLAALRPAAPQLS